jgi:hypothetical protein
MEMLRKRIIVFNVEHNNKVMGRSEDIFFWQANGIAGFGGLNFFLSYLD